MTEYVWFNAIVSTTPPKQKQAVESQQTAVVVVVVAVLCSHSLPIVCVHSQSGFAVVLSLSSLPR